MRLMQAFVAVILASAAAAGGARPASRVVVSDSYIVQVSHTADLSAVAQRVIEATGGRIEHLYTDALWGFSVQLPPGLAKSAVFRSAGVLQVEEDIMLFTCGQQVVPTGVSRINAWPCAIDCSGVDVAIIDSGIDPYHPDLNVVGGLDLTTRPLDPEGGDYNDTYGHGTYVAGILGALDNKDGVVGVAPGARLWAVKVSAEGAKVSDIVKGVDWVARHADQIAVANMSMGWFGKSQALHRAIANCVGRGIVFVVAAGNETSDVYGPDGVPGTNDDFIPAAYPEVATISAMVDTDGCPGGLGLASPGGAPDDSFAVNMSNYSASAVEDNPVQSQGKAIDLVLPGVGIYSTDKDGGYRLWHGTSAAAPHAAGLAVRYIAQYGRAYDAAGVYAIRQALIDAGKNQTDPEYGFVLQNDPDKHKENLGWAE